MIMKNGRLYVADRDRIHILTTDGAYLGAAGRAGQGPGEFRLAYEMGSWLGDSIIVRDNDGRFSIFNGSGKFGRSVLRVASPRFRDPASESWKLREVDHGVYLVRRENLYPDREVMRTVLIWQDMSSDSFSTHGEWDGTWIRRLRNGEIAYPVYPPRAMVEIGLDGAIIYGDGLEYCFTRLSPRDASKKAHRICREWERVRAGAGIRNPDADIIEDQGIRAAFRRVHAEIGAPDLLPSYDMIRVSEEGEIWVRTIGREMADAHPTILRNHPSLVKSTRRWEIFNSQGSLVGAMALDHAFDPRVIVGSEVYGFLSLGFGERVVARATPRNGG
jgi:hypothetical protein